jgi:hypothetical protein
LFTFRLFEYKIVPEYSNNNLNQSTSNITGDQKVILVPSDFSGSTLFKVFKLLGFINLNGINIIVLTIINIFIGKSVKESINKKKYIQNNSNNTTNNKTDETESSLRLMIYYGSLQNIVGRTPSLIYFIINSFIYIHHDFEYINVSTVFLFYFSHLVMFYYTNKMFKSVTIQYLKFASSLLKFR